MNNNVDVSTVPDNREYKFLITGGVNPDDRCRQDAKVFDTLEDAEREFNHKCNTHTGFQLFKGSFNVTTVKGDGVEWDPKVYTVNGEAEEVFLTCEGAKEFLSYGLEVVATNQSGLKGPYQ